MDNIIVVEVVNGLEDLPDRLNGIFLRKLAVFADSVEQFATSGQLSDNIILVLMSPLGCNSYWWVFRTFDSNQSWNRTMCGCFILCNSSISS